MTKAKHKKIKLALYYNRYVPFKIYWGFILQTYIAYLNVYFLDKREMPELHYADLSDTMNTSLAPETEITTIREQVFNIIGLSNNPTTEMNTLEKKNLTMAEYPCSCTHTQLLAVLSVCTCIVFVISALLVWFLWKRKKHKRETNEDPYVQIQPLSPWDIHLNKTLWKTSWTLWHLKSYHAHFIQFFDLQWYANWVICYEIVMQCYDICIL